MTLATLIMLAAMNILPDIAEIALSLRTANDQDSPFDYELSIGGEWTNLEIEAAYEREKGIEYFNYSLVGGNKFIGDWDIEYETRIHDAAGIDRQKLAMMYRAGSWSLGGGIVTSGYRTPLDPVYSVKVGIPYGKLDVTTDFSDIHIWKAVIEHVFGKGDVRPFVRGNLVSDNGDMFYKFKFGVKFTL